MTPERWQRIQDLFFAAEEHNGEDCTRFLATECAGDVELQRSVEELLRSAGRTVPLLKDSVSAVADELLEGGEPQPGNLIGPYELIRILGSGGMGVVYLARRADAEFHQLVAIKLLRAGMYGREILLRFRAERQILANLAHPNVARLLDGGVTSQGQPYLVMEYVEGLPLLAYCREHGLSLRQRFDLFLQVCAGVQCAHQNLVVHRDIKPENILVNGNGIPKLLDFGIAKLLDPQLAQQTIAVTTDTQRLMTPEYASPEQVRGEPITTASDVYSLGVILYELISERRPFQFTTKSLGEIERLVCEYEPPKPSTVAEKQRGARLDSDIDTIVLKAMHKEASHRYAGVGELADDIRRYLSGYPLIAQRDSVTYRMRKFVRRNRWPVAAATVFVLLILGFGTAMGFLAHKARLERDRAEQVSGFLVGMFEQADPEIARGQTITARQILDKGVARIAKLNQEPEIRVRILETFGLVYENIGAWERSRELLEQALKIRRSLYGSESEETAHALKNLAELARRLRDFPPAESMIRESLAIRLKLLGPHHPRYLETVNTLALILHERGRLREAEKLFLEVLASREQLAKVDYLETAVLSNLGGLYTDLGEYGTAEKYLRECVEIRRRNLGPVHPRLANVLGKLASALRDEGKLDEAEAAASEAVAMNSKLFGESSPVVASSLTTLAQVLRQKHQCARSEELLKKAALVQQKTVPAGVRDMEPEFALALLRESEGKYDEAETLLRTVLQQRERVFGERHVRVARTRLALGRVLMETGKVAEAREQIGQAANLLQAATGRAVTLEAKLPQ